MVRFLGLIFLVAMATSTFAVRQQSVGCRGTLRCGDKPASGVRVALWDEDDGEQRSQVSNLIFRSGPR